MPNVNYATGLSALCRNQAGGATQTNLYKKLAATATIIYPGDVVRPLAAGDITAGGTPGTGPWLGVSLNWGAASTATDHLVIDDPSALFECQDDGSGSGILEVDQRLNANFVFTAGDANLRISKHAIAGSTKGVTAGLDARILRSVGTIAVEGGFNTEWGPFNRLEIVFNNHHYSKGAAGI
jgi:hypothetical protein